MTVCLQQAIPLLFTEKKRQSQEKKKKVRENKEVTHSG